MITLQAGVNQLYLTISELNTINNALYSLVILDESTKREKTISVVDTSVNPLRYNQFELTLVDDINNEDLDNAIVYLNTGKHTYKVITTDPSTPFESEICEVGMVKVLRESAQPGQAYTDSIQPTEYVSYTGNINDNI